MTYIDDEPLDGRDIEDDDGDRWRRGEDGLWRMLIGDEEYRDDVYAPQPFEALQELHGPLIEVQP